MSSRHAPRLRQLILARWPERYQSMPLLGALTQMIRTARVYAKPTILVDPRNGQQWPTLAPRPWALRPAPGQIPRDDAQNLLVAG
jgi:hypothetical protein